MKPFGTAGVDLVAMRKNISEMPQSATEISI